MINLDKINFLSLPLTAVSGMEEVCFGAFSGRESALITFVNPQSWAKAEQNPEYVKALEQMDMVLPDGYGVTLAYRLLRREPCKRISFDMTSLAGPFFETAQREGRSVMLVGGKPGVASAVAAKLVNNYPRLKIVGMEDGFRPFAELSVSIMAKNPDAVIVGMGVPRQELFLVALREAGFKGLGITCGGFFDQYLEAERYYPAWIDRLNLRFAYRLYKEPRRLWRRYLIGYRIFAKKLFFSRLGFRLN